MKKILFSCLIIFLIFIIYITNIDKKIYYLHLGNKTKIQNQIKNHLQNENKLETYNKSFITTKPINNIIKDIKTNKKRKNKTIQNALIKADLITIYIDNKELEGKIENKSIDIQNYIENQTTQIEKLFKLIRKYSKENIILIIDSNSNSKTINNLNTKYKIIAQKYNINTYKDNINIKAILKNTKN